VATDDKVDVNASQLEAKGVPADANTTAMCTDKPVADTSPTSIYNVARATKPIKRTVLKVSTPIELLAC
jgi:hypothetical protein